MALELPAPSVPSLQPDNTIDLDQLGSASLETYVWYPGIAAGDFFWPNWRGCGVQGQVVDFFTDVIEVVDEPGPEGMLVMLSNALVKSLDQGWVFYSYQKDGSPPGTRGEESLRRFFYVGKRASPVDLLAVPQCQQSHDLGLDPDVLQSISSVSIVTLPYLAMQSGDQVTLRLERYFDDDSPYEPLTYSKTLIDAQLGQPLLWAVEPTDLLIIKDGSALISYSVVYATPTSPTVSSVQKLSIIKPVKALLPALSIKDFTGASLDPSAYPDGITLEIAVYPGIQSGDDVLVYIISDNSSLIKTLRVDPSTLDSGVLQFNVPKIWLMDNFGTSISLIYQYARVGAAGTSEAYEVMLRLPMKLPPPIVQGAIPEDSEEGEYKGYIFAKNAFDGVKINIPTDAVVGPEDKVQMHWEGAGMTGSHIADPSPGNPLLFQIPASAVPANMAKRVKVYYRVIPEGEAFQDSDVFDLEVRPITSNWPVIQVVRPRISDLQLSLAAVTEAGVGLELVSWSFMAEGQRVRIIASALLADNTLSGTFDMRTGDAERVTEDEYYDGTLSVSLPRSYLETLQLNKQITVTVDTSFDEGVSYRQFPSINITLVQ